MMILNYFDCRGRVQPIRNYLREREISFVDNRVSVADGFQEWSAKANDPSFSGELGLLPTFRFGSEEPLFSETLVIAFELDKQMNLADRSLISSTYQDILVNIGLFIWCDAAFPGVDLKAAGEIMFSRMCQRFSSYEKMMTYFEIEESYSLAQHFMGESIDAAHYVFGSKYLDFLKGMPNLSQFSDLYQERVAGFPRPRQFTSRPGEADVVARLRSL